MFQSWQNEKWVVEQCWSYLVGVDTNQTKLKHLLFEFSLNKKWYDLSLVWVYRAKIKFRSSLTRIKNNSVWFDSSSSWFYNSNQWIVTQFDLNSLFKFMTWIYSSSSWFINKMTLFYLNNIHNCWFELQIQIINSNYELELIQATNLNY